MEINNLRQHRLSEAQNVVTENVQNYTYMPAVSTAQQQAAGIAHAVEKGELPKSKLKGASKQMFKSMKGKGELHKFASTEHAGLPKHKSEESVQDKAQRLVDELLS